jgi:[amino group carrier protein]-L-2-aminoadipate 6-kinase
MIKKEIIVVKVGSHDSKVGNFAKDISKYSKNAHVIVVHGGNYELTKWLLEKENIKVEDQIIYSEHGQKSRLTTKKVIEKGLYPIYCGVRNKKLVAELQKEGVDAVGLSGIDAHLISGKKHSHTRYIKNGKKIIDRNDLTGKITKINSGFLKMLLKEGVMPVITPPAFDHDLKKAINVDGDKVTIKIAEEMKADKVLFLFNAAGFMEGGSLLPRIKKDDLEKHLPSAKDGMKKKLLSVIKLRESSPNTEVIFSSFASDTPFTDAIKNKKGTHIY